MSVDIMSQRAFIVCSYVMFTISTVGMFINVGLYVTHIINEATLILITLVLSYLALIFSAYGNIISAQVNEKVERMKDDYER